MKNFKTLIVLGIILSFGILSGCGNKKTSNFSTEDLNAKSNKAIEYNNSIINIASQCPIAANIVRDAYENNDEIENIESFTKNTITECQNAINQINTIGDFEGDNTLENGVTNILNLYIDYFTKFNNMLTYLENENLTKEDQKSYESLVEEIKSMDELIESANNEFLDTQENFAEKYGFELGDIE